MNKDDIQPKTKVRNIKYGTTEEILFIGKMKDSQKGWIDAVVYGGIDRNNNKYQRFCKEINSFCNEFELYKSDKFVNIKYV